MRKSYEMDMTRGPLLRSILIFTLPLLLSGVVGRKGWFGVVSPPVEGFAGVTDG